MPKNHLKFTLNTITKNFSEFKLDILDEFITARSPTHADLLINLTVENLNLDINEICPMKISNSDTGLIVQFLENNFSYITSIESNFYTIDYGIIIEFG